MPVKIPVDFNAIRVALVRQVETVTKATCIVAEPETQNAPRPCKPYFTMKMTGPAGKSGDDSAEQIKDNLGVPTTVWNRGGQRKLSVDFNCYGTTHEEAYNLLTLWQGALELETVQAALYASGIAVWLNGSVNDLSQLLNTAFEGRAQMQVDFGIASNLTEDLSSIDTVNVSGTVTDGASVNEAVVVTVTAP